MSFFNFSYPDTLPPSPLPQGPWDGEDSGHGLSCCVPSSSRKTNHCQRHSCDSYSLASQGQCFQHRLPWNFPRLDSNTWQTLAQPPCVRVTVRGTCSWLVVFNPVQKHKYKQPRQYASSRIPHPYFNIPWKGEFNWRVRQELQNRNVNMLKDFKEDMKALEI